MSHHLTQIAAAMTAGGYANFKEFADAAVAAGYVVDDYIDFPAFIADGAHRLTTEEN